MTAAIAELDATLDRAAALCTRRGAQLTELRRQVLRLVIGAGQPLGAYALLDQLRASRAGAAPPTVYRALDFLVEQGLIHKVERLGAFIGCTDALDHPDDCDCGEAHDHPHQFLICRRCGSTAEISDPGVALALARAARAAGFTPARATVEMEGLCAACGAGGMSPGFEVAPGWVPGAIGDLAALHARHYAASHGFGLAFEAKVAREMGDFLARLDPARDLFRCVPVEGRVLGSIALDGGEPGLPPGTAHLRWFILAAELRGSGLGRRLLGEALAQARAAGFAEVFLWTLAGLPAAEALYAAAGFTLAEEITGRQWGRAVVERRLVLRLG